jgi:HK97 family phage portal protein
VGLFSRFRKKPKAENSLSTSRSVFWGGSTSGTVVNEMTAMQTAAVYSCVRVIAEAVASLPLHVYRYESNGTIMTPEHHLYNILHHAPNPEMTSFDFRETLMFHLLIYGNAYAQIIRDSAGRVTALYPLLPNKMDVWRGESGEIYYTYWREFDERVSQEKTGGVTLRRDQVLHVRGLSFNGLVGYSPIALAKNAVGMAIATENYGAGFFSNGSNPGGVIETPATVKKPEKLRESWELLYKGSQNSGRIAILEEGLTVHPISIAPEQAQFLETRKFQINEIARIFRVPPHMIGDLEKSSFSNIEQQSLEFVKYCLQPWLKRWEQGMWQSLILPSEKSTHFIKFNLDGLLRGDYETRHKGYAIGIQNGYMSPNDVRKLENLNEIPEEKGGFNYMVNGNMVKLEDVGAAYLKNLMENEEP